MKLSNLILDTLTLSKITKRYLYHYSITMCKKAGNFMDKHELNSEGMNEDVKSFYLGMCVKWHHRTSHLGISRTDYQMCCFDNFGIHLTLYCKSLNCYCIGRAGIDPLAALAGHSIPKNT